MRTSNPAPCDEIRAALSARLDAEPLGMPADRLEHHLAGCAGCRAWLRAAEQVTRTARVQRVTVPDLTEPILAAVAAATAAQEQAVREQAASRRQILRLALGVSALVQFMLAIPVLLAGLGVAGVVDPHTSREAASFDIAIAVGFALAAWRPERARAFVPVAFVLTTCLALTSAYDLADGFTVVTHELVHLAALAQAGLLWALSRQYPAQTSRAAVATVGR